MKDETVAYLVLPAFIVVVFGGGDGGREHGERGLLELPRHALKPDVVASVVERVEEAEEERRAEAAGADAEARGVAEDGAPPRLAGGSAADDIGGVKAAEDLEEEVARKRRPDFHVHLFVLLFPRRFSGKKHLERPKRKLVTVCVRRIEKCFRN
jgi:hypothetical protein